MLYFYTGERQPVLKDRSKLPYIDAVLMETLRYMSHVPLSVPHNTTKDTTLGGYQIPKNTQVGTLA